MIFFFFLFLQIQLTDLHPIHVSVSDVEINASGITWTARIYKDDLLLGMYGKNLNVDVLDDRARVEKDIYKYLIRNISILYEGKQIRFELKDIESDPEAIWITVSSLTSITTSAKLVFQNRILLDVYNDQKNVVNFKWDTGKKNFVFEKGREKETINIL